MQWGLSTYLSTAAMGSISALASGYVAPASFDAGTKLSSFTVESATIGSDGSAVINMDGAALAYAPTGNRWLKLDDLVVDVDSAGNGELSAAVSYGPGVGSYPTSSYDPTVAPYRGPTRVEIVDLVGNTASENTVTSDVSSFPALDGTWSPDLITFLSGDATADPVVPGLSYRSQLVNDAPAKAPQPLNISVDLAVATTTATFGTATEAGVPVAVEGTGFKKTAPGVYVSLREYAEGAAAYAGGAVWSDGPTAWISNDAADIGPDPATGASAAIGEDGSFETTLLPTPAMLEALDPTKVYSVVTRKAHGQGTIPTNADQITETPLDVSDLKADTTVGATVADSISGTPATVDVTVSAAEGTPGGNVTVKNGDTVVGTGTLTAGASSIPVSGLPVGATALTVEYAGSVAHWPSAGATTATVTKATSAVTTGGASGTTYGKTAVVTATVPGAGSVTLTGLGATQTQTLAAAGTASFTVPASLAAGAYTATFAYGGDDAFAGSQATKAFSVKKATTRTALKVAKPTAKKRGKATVTVAGVKPGSKVVVTIKGGGKKAVKKTVKVNAKGKAVVALAKAPKGGSFRVTAVYAGDANHLKSSDNAAYKVKKAKKR